jgi:hypothetical protein
MNFFEAQEFFKQMYPGKPVLFEFDSSCIRFIECVHTDNEMHDTNHIQYEKLKVTVQGMQPVYIPIMPHRMLISADDVKKHIANVKVKKNEPTTS